jgi:hypothetical protein
MAGLGSDFLVGNDMRDPGGQNLSQRHFAFVIIGILQGIVITGILLRCRIISTMRFHVRTIFTNAQCHDSFRVLAAPSITHAVADKINEAPNT